jgi:hypothetical protein
MATSEAAAEIVSHQVNETPSEIIVLTAALTGLADGMRSSNEKLDNFIQTMRSNVKME